jgi:hypothetical protein
MDGLGLDRTAFQLHCIAPMGLLTSRFLSEKAKGMEDDAICLFGLV